MRTTLSPGIDALRRRIESGRVLFDPGSFRVTAAGMAEVRGLATAMRLLSDSAAAIGASLRIDLVGRTDPTGTDATNQSLAQLRVDAVMARLRAAGVRAAVMNGRPLATAQPLAAADAAEHARINRSVSFEVVVTNASLGPRGP